MKGTRYTVTLTVTGQINEQLTSEQVISRVRNIVEYKTNHEVTDILVTTLSIDTIPDEEDEEKSELPGLKVVCCRCGVTTILFPGQTVPDGWGFAHYLNYILYPITGLLVPLYACPEHKEDK